MTATLEALIDLNNALNEVQRLRKQRRILVRHLRDRQVALRVSRRIRHVLEQNLTDHQVAILRVSEQRDHLRAELTAEKRAAQETTQSLRADLDAVRAAANDLDTKWRQALEAQCQAIVDRDIARGQLAIAHRDAARARISRQKMSRRLGREIRRRKEQESAHRVLASWWRGLQSVRRAAAWLGLLLRPCSPAPITWLPRRRSLGAIDG